MNRPNQIPKQPSPMRQDGFSMIELMVAILIGLFLTLGLSKIFISMYSTSQSQGVLFQFQANQRQGVTSLINIVQLASYYSSTPTTAGANTTALPASTNAGDSTTFVAGAGIVGKTGTGTPEQDTINIQYQSSGVDNIYNCQGGVTTAGSNTTVVNSFSINSSNQLICTVSVSAGTATTALVLANNVQSMTVLYAIDTTSGTSTPAYTTDVYMNSTQVTANAAWLKVRAVQITLNFCTANVTSPVSTACTTTTPWVQTINLMGKS